MGVLLVTIGLGAFGVVFARTLLRARLPRTPLLSHYTVVALALPAWLAPHDGSDVACPSR